MADADIVETGEGQRSARPRRRRVPHGHEVGRSCRATRASPPTSSSTSTSPSRARATTASSVEREPHRLLEGTAIAALAIGCETAYIYVRGEYLWQSIVLERAIAEAYAGGYLGADICGSDKRVDVVLHRGAGAYICGEETALLNSLEGLRGQPRLRPPFPAVEGLFASPTVINNVETLMNVPDIITQRRRVVPRGRHREVARLEDGHDQRQGRTSRQLRDPAGHAVFRGARGAGRRHARAAGR